MSHLKEKVEQGIKQLIVETEKEKGELTFFGLFRAEETPDKWDIVVSAKWVEEGELKAVDYLIEKISKYAPSILPDISRLETYENKSFLPVEIPVVKNGKKAKHIDRVVIGEVKVLDGYVFRNREGREIKGAVKA